MKPPKMLVLLMISFICAVMIVHVLIATITNQDLDNFCLKVFTVWHGWRSLTPLNPKVPIPIVDHREISKIAHVRREAFGPFGPFDPSGSPDSNTSGFSPPHSFPMPTGFPDSQSTPKSTVIVTQTVIKSTSQGGTSTNTQTKASVIPSSGSAYSSTYSSEPGPTTGFLSTTLSAGLGTSSSSPAPTSSSGPAIPPPPRAGHTSLPRGVIVAAVVVGVLFMLAILTLLVKLSRRRRAEAAATRAELASPFKLEDAEAGVSRRPSAPQWKARDQLSPPVPANAAVSSQPGATQASPFPNEKQSTLDSPTASELYDTIERRLTAADVWATRQTRLIQENAALRAAVRELEMEARRASGVRSELPPDYENVESSESSHVASHSSISS